MNSSLSSVLREPLSAAQVDLDVLRFDVVNARFEAVSSRFVRRIVWNAVMTDSH